MEKSQINVNEAFDPQMRQAQAELNDYLESRPSQDAKGKLHDPESGKFMNLEDAGKVYSNPEAGLTEADDYNSMTPIQLAKLSAEAELNGDKTTMSSVDDALQAKFDKYDTSHEHKDGTKREKSEQENVFERVMNYREQHLSELNGEQEAHEANIAEEKAAEKTESVFAAPDPNTGIGSPYLDKEGQPIIAVKDFEFELSEMLENNDNSKFLDLANSWYNTAKYEAGKTGDDSLVKNVDGLLRAAAKKLGVEVPEAPVDTNPDMVINDYRADKGEHVRPVFGNDKEATSETNEPTVVDEETSESTVEEPQELVIRPVDTLINPINRPAARANRAVGSTEVSTSKEKKTTRRRLLAFAVGALALVGLSALASNNDDSATAQNTLIEQPDGVTNHTSLEATEAPAEAPVVHNEVRTDVVGTDLEGTEVNLDDWSWKVANQLVPGHENAVITAGVERYNAANEGAAFSLNEEGRIVNLEGRQVNPEEMNKINQYTLDVIDDLEGLTANS
ncbi:MAG: hypothetical protein M3Q70_01185 [bacterium]|nr:hypothetical protein [bacterium]